MSHYVTTRKSSGRNSNFKGSGTRFKFKSKKRWFNFFKHPFEFESEVASAPTHAQRQLETLKSLFFAHPLSKTLNPPPSLTHTEIPMAAVAPPVVGRELLDPPTDGITNLRFSNHSDHLLVSSWDRVINIPIHPFLSSSLPTNPFFLTFCAILS